MADNLENNNEIPEVRILHNGPIMLKGNFSFRDSSGNITSGEQELYLCRCGGSKNKPWCDETHKTFGVPG